VLGQIEQAIISNFSKIIIPNDLIGADQLNEPTRLV
jgi:hypothetical protein